MIPYYRSRPSIVPANQWSHLTVTSNTMLWLVYSTKCSIRSMRSNDSIQTIQSIPSSNRFHISSDWFHLVGSNYRSILQSDLWFNLINSIQLMIQVFIQLVIQSECYQWVDPNPISSKIWSILIQSTSIDLISTKRCPFDPSEFIWSY